MTDSKRSRWSTIYPCQPTDRTQYPWTCWGSGYRKPSYRL